MMNTSLLVQILNRIGRGDEKYYLETVSCVLISWNDDDATKRAPAPVDVHFALKAICESRSLRFVDYSDQLLSELQLSIAKQSVVPTVVYLPDVDFLFPRVGDFDEESLIRLLQLIALLKRSETRLPVLILASTYRPSNVHRELMQRFDDETPFSSVLHLTASLLKNNTTMNSNTNASLSNIQLSAPPSSELWNSLGGLENVKRRVLLLLDVCLAQVLAPSQMQHVITHASSSTSSSSSSAGFSSEKFPISNSGKGVILHGRPGVGKTQLVRALAALRGVPLRSLSLSEILASEIGEAERRLRRAFSVSVPHILFVDEIQAMFVRRSSSRSFAQTLTTQFLFLLDSLPAGVFVIGATNLPEALDYSLLAGRLPLLEVPPPSAKDRVTILRSITQQMPVASDVNLEQIAMQCEDSTGAELHFVCRTAALRAMSLQLMQVNQQHLLFAVEALRSRKKKP